MNGAIIELQRENRRVADERDMLRKTLEEVARTAEDWIWELHNPLGSQPEKDFYRGADRVAKSIRKIIKP